MDLESICDGGPKASVDEAHYIDLLPDVSEKVFLREVILGQESLPRFRRRGLRVLFAGIGDAGSDFGVGGMREVGGLHLLAKKFLTSMRRSRTARRSSSVN